jgi:hypothetical protein
MARVHMLPEVGTLAFWRKKLFSRRALTPAHISNRFFISKHSPSEQMCSNFFWGGRALDFDLKEKRGVQRYKHRLCDEGAGEMGGDKPAGRASTKMCTTV